MPKKSRHSDDAADTAAPTDQYVYLCDVSRRELFMLPTSHSVTGTCDRCGAVGVQCFQYLRSDLRLDHLAAADRDAFNAKLDAAAAVTAAAIEAQAAADALAEEAEATRLAAEIAANDAAYAAAIDARLALDAADTADTATA